ncbi:MAG: methyltransferase [bacterium]
MEPLTDVRQISRIAYGYMASQALFTALEFGLFTSLSGKSNSLQGLAGDTGIAANRLESLLAALVSLGLLVKEGGRFANAPASETYLVRGAPGDYGEYLRVVNGRMFYSGFAKLEPALRGERAFSDKGFYDGVFYQANLDAADFSKAQHDGSMGPATLLAKRFDLSDCGRLLDVGGGSGAFTIALCRRNPELTSTILDFPATVETAREYVAAAGLPERIGHLSGNALTTDWPGGQDVVLMSYLWSAVGRDDIANLARRAHEALKPGGRVLVHDFMAAKTGDGPPIAVWHLLGSIIDNPEAVCLTAEFVSGILDEAGFTGMDASELLPGITTVVTARKEG